MKGRWSLYRYVRGLQVSGMPVPPELQRYRFPWATDAEWERQRGARDARAEAACRMRAWAADHLAELEPRVGQAPDTHLGPWVAWLPLAKRSKLARFCGRTSEIRQEKWGLRIRADIDARALGPGPLAGLEKAFDKVAKTQLKQMRNPDLRSVGAVTGAQIQRDGFIAVTCTVTDPVAARKISNRTYSGIMLSLDGDEVSDISLIDAPSAFDLEKRGGMVIAKIYSNEGAMQKKDRKMAEKIAREANVPFEWALVAVQSVRKTATAAPSQPQLPASALTAVDAVMETATVLANGGNGDSMAAKAAYDRARQAYGLEMVKMARRPAAVGDNALVAFLRHGRP